VTHDLREAIALADRLVFLTSRPMRVLKEIDVLISREKRDAQNVENFREQLIKNYSELRLLV
jgi:NitT/TauT family transport system ATP-binding protein